MFVDDGSQDASYDALQRSLSHWPNVQIIRHAQHRGLIATLQTEFHRCASKWVAVLDPAGPYDPVLLIDIVNKADREGYDAVTASPRQGSGTAGNAASWGGTLLRVTSWLYRWSMRNQLSCYTSAVSVYTASWVKQRKLIHRGRVGLTELLWQLDCLGARIGEVPVTLAPRLAGWSTEVATGTLLSHLRLLAASPPTPVGSNQPVECYSIPICLRGPARVVAQVSLVGSLYLPDSPHGAWTLDDPVPGWRSPPQPACYHVA